MRPPKMSQGVSSTFRLPAELVAELDVLALRLRAATPGSGAVRADAARIALMRGIAELKKELPEVEASASRKKGAK